VVNVVEGSLDTTTVLPSDKVKVAVMVLLVGMLIGDTVARLLVCAIFAALNLSVRTGAAVGAPVVGAPVGACVGGNMGGGGGAFTATRVVDPASMALGLESVTEPVVSCTVPPRDAAVKVESAGTVS
jgi:hypothetical protein